MVKLAPKVCAVAGLIVLLVLVAAIFLKSEPVSDNKAALRHVDDDRNKVAEIRREHNPDVIPNRNLEPAKPQSSVTESYQWQGMPLDLTNVQTENYAGHAAAKVSQLEELRTAKEWEERYAPLTELEAAAAQYENFLRNSDYSSYDMDTLWSLAEGMDSKAQIMLAENLLFESQSFPDLNDDTRAAVLQFAVAAAESGEPRAATLASSLSIRNNDPVLGYSYLLKFEQKYGDAFLVRRHIDIYPILSGISAGELNRRVQPYMSN